MAVRGVVPWRLADAAGCQMMPDRWRFANRQIKAQYVLRWGTANADIGAPSAHDGCAPARPGAGRQFYRRIPRETRTPQSQVDRAIVIAAVGAIDRIAGVRPEAAGKPT